MSQVPKAGPRSLRVDKRPTTLELEAGPEGTRRRGALRCAQPGFPKGGLFFHSEARTTSRRLPALRAVVTRSFHFLKNHTSKRALSTTHLRVASRAGGWVSARCARPKGGSYSESPHSGGPDRRASTKGDRQTT